MKTQLKLVVVEDSVADAELLARHLAKARLDCAINRVQTEAEFIDALRRVKPGSDSLRFLPAAASAACGPWTSPSRTPRICPLSMCPEPSARNAPSMLCAAAPPTMF